MLMQFLEGEKSEVNREAVFLCNARVGLVHETSACHKVSKRFKVEFALKSCIFKSNTSTKVFIFQ